MSAWLLSRIGAVAIIVAIPVLIANCSRVSYAALNAPAYLASYQRYADIRYGEPGDWRPHSHSIRAICTRLVAIHRGCADGCQAPYTPADWQITALARAHSPPSLLLHGSDDIFPEAVADLDANLRGHGNYVECHI